MNTDKKYKYINIKLYKDFFRQLSIISLIFLGILMLFTVIIPINGMLDAQSVSIYQRTKSVVNIHNSFFHYLFMYTLYVPLLVLYAFNFLTKRNACDYYHSLPHKRICLYFTVTASVVSWLLIVLAVNTAASVIIYTALNKYFILNIGKLLLFSFSIFVCSLLVTASIILACTITGTTFTNIAVSGIIIFLPRILITALSSFVTDAQGVFVDDKLFPLFYSNTNLVFDTVLSVSWFRTPSFFDAAPIIYTCILAAVYFTAAGFLFVRRKSETAGTPAAGRKTQCVIRISIALPVTLFALPVIYNRIIGIQSIGIRDLFNLFIIYTIAIIVMFIYEFISSRKIRNIVKAIPSFGILILTNILIVTGLYIIDVTQLNYTPSGDEIEYITLPPEDDMFSCPTYFERLLGNYKITEPSLVNFVSDKLAETVKYCKNDEAYDIFCREDYSEITVGIKSGPFMKYRNLCVPVEEYTLFYNLLYSNDKIMQIFTNLPEYDKYSSRFEMLSVIDENNAKELYNLMRDELKSVNPTEWAQLLQTDTAPLSLNLQTIIDDQYDDPYTYTSMPLSKLTPKTLLSYINIKNSSITKDEADKICGIIDRAFTDDGNLNDDIEYDFTINVFSDDYNAIKSYCYLDSEYYYDEEPAEIYEIHDMENIMTETSKETAYDEEEEETLIALIDDPAELIDFVKYCFSNPVPVDSLDKEGFSLISINFAGYDYSALTYDDEADAFTNDGELFKSYYMLMESDKISQYIAEHADEI